MPAVITKGEIFDVNISRHFIEIFDAIADEKIREINILAPPRSGKTLIADITVPWAIEFDNAAILYVMQTDEMAASHAELRIMPILFSSPYIKSILPSDKYKIRTTEVIFSTGLPLIITGPSISKLQTRSFKYVIIDEAWVIADKYPGRIEEAKTRLGDYIREESSKLIVLSQAGNDGDDWHRQYNSGAIREWQVKCIGCGKHFYPVFNGTRDDGSRFGLVWEHLKNEHGKVNYQRALETIRYVCPLCGYEHVNESKTKSYWNLNGKYEYKNPIDYKPTRLSFHWNNLIDYPWPEIVREWLWAIEARDEGNEMPVIQFIQKRLAEFPQHIDVEYSHIPTFDKEIKKKYRFLTVDVQRDEYWLMVADWSENSEMRIIFADKVHTWQAIDEIQKKFEVEPQYVFVDCGYNQAEVAAQCALHGKVINGKFYCWFALKGSSAENFPVRYQMATIMLPYTYPPKKLDPLFGLRLDDPRREKLRGIFVPLIIWSNPTIKDIAAKRRQMMETGDKVFVSPEVSEHFKTHMYSEHKKQLVRKDGKIVWQWTRISNRPNHLWDCFCMQIVAACLARLIKVIPDEEKFCI